MRKPIPLLISAAAAALILAAPIGPAGVPARAQVDVTITAGIAPPALPVYDQPPIPGTGYVWIPGYWAWDGQEYYWVPGYWAAPPAANLLWTPPYWAWNDGAYNFYPGYWAPTVGYYGGIDYGFGYTGEGYQGGYWRDNQFFYNTAVNNLAGAQIANTYTQAVPAAPNANRVSFNGGAEGTRARPTEAEIAARGRARAPTVEQTLHQTEAGRDPSLRFSANHGRPPTMAMQRANAFHGAGQAAAHPGEMRPQGGQGGAGAAVGPSREAGRGPAAGRNFMDRGPAMHGPTGRQGFAYHGAPMNAPGARQGFAYHPTGGAARFNGAPRVGGAPNFGGMRMGGEPRFGGMRMGGAPQFNGAPHMGGAPNFGAMHMGGGAPHFTGAPHMGGGPNFGGMRMGGGPPHMGGGPPHMGGGPHGGGGPGKRAP